MTTPSFENVAVMGAGAVGCYFGAMLARAGAQVRLIGRPALVDAVARDGLRFEGIDFKGRIALSATTDPAGVAGAGLVLFSVKSPDTEAAARAIAPHLAPGAVVLSLQNGVDNVERLRAQIANVVVPAVVYVAAEIPAPGVIRHNGRGDLVIGTLGPPQADDALMARLAAYLAGASIPTRISDNVEGELWWKLILNCAYNAVSALGRSRYGPMMAMPEIRQVMTEAVREIIALAKAKGVRVAAGNLLDGAGLGARPSDGDRLPQRLRGARVRCARIAGAGQSHTLRAGEAVGAGADFVMATVGRNKPPGPAFGRPDDKLSALRRSRAKDGRRLHSEAAQCATLIAPYRLPARAERS